MDKDGRLDNLLVDAIKEQTKVLIIPSIIAITLIVIAILVWYLDREKG